ncbi:hypothetical protein [Nocardia sp. CA-119907]|uniref:hypothetical protein n=1 Tax=Nocardia sp. CA-119907 TaxID=3239973 RepID=UPI003D9954E8
MSNGSPLFAGRHLEQVQRAVVRGQIPGHGDLRRRNLPWHTRCRPRHHLLGRGSYRLEGERTLALTTAADELVRHEVVLVGDSLTIRDPERCVFSYHRTTAPAQRPQRNRTRATAVAGASARVSTEASTQTGLSPDGHVRCGTATFTTWD